MEWIHSDFPAKKKFRAQRSVKKVMEVVFTDMKGFIATEFVEDSATVNNIFYNQRLGKFHLSYWIILIYIYIA